jgi:hypothetical protein
LEHGCKRLQCRTDRLRGGSRSRPHRCPSRKAQCGKPHAGFDVAGGWKPAYGSDSEALSTETESNG